VRNDDFDNSGSIAGPEPERRQTSSGAQGGPGIKILVALILFPLLAGPAYLFLAECADGLRTTREEGMRVCLDQMKEMQKAIQLYHLEHGDWPESLEVLTQPTEDAPDGYLSEVPLDPWKESYVYRPGTTTHFRDLEIFSKGPDRRPDTEDDIHLSEEFR
jgi:hypothetical protein